MTHIPDCALESFYRGIVYVCIKDAVFQPSTPLRHATEVKGIIGDKMKDLRVLLMYTDGGPDHNVKYLTVWVSLICLFLSGDLDLLVAARTCPTQSWKKCAVVAISYRVLLAVSDWYKLCQSISV